MTGRKKGPDKIKIYNIALDETKKAIIKIREKEFPKSKLEYLSDDDKKTLDAINLHSSLAILGLKKKISEAKITDKEFDQSVSTIIELYEDYIEGIKEDVDEKIANAKIQNNKDYLKDYR